MALIVEAKIGFIFAAEVIAMLYSKSNKTIDIQFPQLVLMTLKTINLERFLSCYII